MNDADVDEIGIRNTPPNLVYSANDASLWRGSGVLNKPISDFHNSGLTFSSMQGAPYFAQSGKIEINVRQFVIPEPAEYALIFGLFALAFVIFRRHFQKN